MAAREQAPLQQQQANKRPMGQQRMLWLYPPAAAAVAVRLALMGLGLGSYLAWRPEVTTPANGALYLREGVRMLQLGVSPYRGSNCHAPPLLLALFAPLAQHELLLGLPNVLADCCAAWCVAQLAAQLTRPQHGRAAQAADTGAWLEPHQLAAFFLWNPFGILACASGGTSPLENAAVLLALAAAAAGNGPVAAFGVALGAYLSLHPLLLALPLAIMLARGCESVFTTLGSSSTATDSSTANGALASGIAAGGESGSPAASSQQAPAAHTSSGTVAASGCNGPLTRRRAAVAAAAVDGGCDAGASLEVPQPPQQQLVPSSSVCPPASAAALQRPAQWRRSAVFAAWVCVWGLALVALSDISLRRHPDAQCLPRLLPQALQGRSGPGGAATAAAGAPGCWASGVWGFLLGVRDYTPNIGLFWYFFTEMFDAFRPFFRFVFHSHAALMAAPLALRFPRRPLFLVWAQLLISCLFKPYPTVGDLVPWMAVLPLLQQQLGLVRLGLMLVNSFGLLVVLGPAMWHQWIMLDAANSNFFYSITLLFGAWQVLLLVQMCLMTCQVELLDAGKAAVQVQPAAGIKGEAGDAQAAGTANAMSD